MVQLNREQLAQFINANAIDLSAMDLASFRTWLRARIDDAARQPLFAQRCLIRDLTRANRRQLRDRERRLEDAEQAYRQHPAFSEIENSAREIGNLEKAVAGLTTAVSEKRADPEKLAEFESDLTRTKQHHWELVSNLPEKKRRDRAIHSLERFRDEIGLREAEEILEGIGENHGSGTVAAGGRFEALSSEAATRFILPDVGEPGERLVVLHGLTLGCARGEFDQMVVTVPRDDEIVQVRAVVEAKRNINDLVHGFRLRQENLAWLTGDRAGYSTDLYRTRDYPEGHFDSVAEHEEQGQKYRFDQRSFRDLAAPQDSGKRLSGMYFVTEERPLLGVTSSELGRILHRVATDPGFNIDSDAILRQFRKWAKTFVADVQTRDVLEMYAQDEHLARHVIFAASRRKVR